jgi:hypothetical protein
MFDERRKRKAFTKTNARASMVKENDGKEREDG